MQLETVDSCRIIDAIDLIGAIHAPGVYEAGSWALYRGTPFARRCNS